ncbi:phosphonate ABC transporter ATP-binding protein [Paracoccus angustae]|uniref:Phosphonate ABC transporter ATP-binding protein n=1 Tax=Paracoccus angustae TaxID=1671480 RepID=A0ABV7U655_9RHOB
MIHEPFRAPGPGAPNGGRPPVLDVRNLKVSYAANGPMILKGLDFAVGGGDFCAVIGPSGAGKSTLIRCINRLVEPTEGSITLFGQDVRALHGGQLRRLRRRIGMIFQEFNLVNRMSVMDNVLSGRLGYTGPVRSFFKAFPREDVDRALHLLERVGLQDHVAKRADALSGGQRQRVGIARALMQKPEILLLDEPTSALDPKISRDVMRLIRELADELHVPVLCNIHDVQLALETCNRIIGMQDGWKKFDGPSTGMRKQDLDAIYAMEVL